MNKKSKSILLFLIVGIIILLSCFINVYFIQREEATVKIAIYPIGTAEGTYYFELVEDTLICSVGSRWNDNIKTNNFLQNTYKKQESKINTQELQNLSNLLNELQLSGYDAPKRLALDSWYIALLYNGNIYEANYWDESGVLKRIIDEIIRLSPIPVYLQGFA